MAWSMPQTASHSLLNYLAYTGLSGPTWIWKPATVGMGLSCLSSVVSKLLTVGVARMMTAKAFHSWTEIQQHKATIGLGRKNIYDRI